MNCIDDTKFSVMKDSKVWMKIVPSNNGFDIQIPEDVEITEAAKVFIEAVMKLLEESKQLKGDSMQQVLESMTKVTTAKYIVRVWRDEDLSYQSSMSTQSEIENVVTANWDLSAVNLAKKIAEVPRVSAVEVLHLDGNGVVFYPDWK